MGATALADFAYESFTQGEIARLEEARLAALEERRRAHAGRAPPARQGSPGTVT